LQPPNPVPRNLDSMLDYLGMRVEQECCEFRRIVGRGKERHLRHLCTSGRRLRGVLWCGVAVAATHPVLRNLDSNVGLFRNECQAGVL
jgi:hypothetical protein